MTEEELATNELNNLEPVNARKLKILKMEYDVWLSFGRKVPEQVTNKQWLNILNNETSVSARIRTYKYLFKNEKANENEKLKKEERRIIQEEKAKKRDRQIQEGIYEEVNTILIHIRETTMTKSYYNNLFFAMLNGPHLVFDMSFEEHMNKREMKQVTKQLVNCHGSNKISRQPFHLHLCGLEEHGQLNKYLNTKFPGFSKLPITTTEKSYLDLYPHDRLVYLSPNSRNVLKEYNPDDVYIIGGIVDLGGAEPLTFSKAKKEGIRSAKLPLDMYLR